MYRPTFRLLVITVISATAAPAISRAAHAAQDGSEPGHTPDLRVRPGKQGRVVLVPTLIGGASDETAPLIGALAEGMRDNPRWVVESGARLTALRGAAQSAAVPATPADWERLGDQLAGAAAALAAGPAPGQAVAALEPLRSELLRAFRAGPWSERGASLLYRGSGLLAAAYAASSMVDKAKQMAGETALLFPGRQPTDVDGLPPEAIALLREATPATGAGMGAGAGVTAAVAAVPATATLRIVTRPQGCAVVVNGVAVGQAPVEIGVLAGEAYYGRVECAGRASRTTRRLLPSAQAAARQEVLDLEFESALDWTGDLKLRYPSPADRKAFEESYSRRTAEMFEADAVVFTSVGQLGGADVINARLYLKSGYFVRQGYARLETVRVRALGAFIATGKAAPGVLRAEDAAAMAMLPASSQSPPRSPAPWYTDWVGWTLSGAGVAALATGAILVGMSRDKKNEADTNPEARLDPSLQAKLRQDADTLEFQSVIALGLGGTLLLTGVLVLVIPESAETKRELMSLAPTPVPGGGVLSCFGRF